VLKAYLSDPLTARPSKSDSAMGRSMQCLLRLETLHGIREVVVRDRLVQRDRRFVLLEISLLAVGLNFVQ